jgi:hypothetical protein
MWPPKESLADNHKLVPEVTNPDSEFTKSVPLQKAEVGGVVEIENVSRRETPSPIYKLTRVDSHRPSRPWPYFSSY